MANVTHPPKGEKRPYFGKKPSLSCFGVLICLIDIDFLVTTGGIQCQELAFQPGARALRPHGSALNLFGSRKAAAAKGTSKWKCNSFRKSFCFLHLEIPGESPAGGFVGDSCVFVSIEIVCAMIPSDTQHATINCTNFATTKNKGNIRKTLQDTLPPICDTKPRLLVKKPPAETGVGFAGCLGLAPKASPVWSSHPLPLPKNTVKPWKELEPPPQRLYKWEDLQILMLKTWWWFLKYHYQGKIIQFDLRIKNQTAWNHPHPKRSLKNLRIQLTKSLAFWVRGVRKPRTPSCCYAWLLIGGRLTNSAPLPPTQASRLACEPPKSLKLYIKPASTTPRKTPLSVMASAGKKKQKLLQRCKPLKSASLWRGEWFRATKNSRIWFTTSQDRSSLRHPMWCSILLPFMLFQIVSLLASSWAQGRLSRTLEFFFFWGGYHQWKVHCKTYSQCCVTTE